MFPHLLSYHWINDNDADILNIFTLFNILYILYVNTRPTTLIGVFNQPICSLERTFLSSISYWYRFLVRAHLAPSPPSNSSKVNNFQALAKPLARRGILSQMQSFPSSGSFIGPDKFGGSLFIPGSPPSTPTDTSVYRMGLPPLWYRSQV